TYIDWLLDLPWNKSSEDDLDIAKAEKVLNEDHYGLDDVKDRIVEYLAVRKMAGQEMRAQVLCFVGPPGVGKTSLGMSIARAMGRQFVNIALGGLGDEAEIRGHRRTYVASMPGKIIQKIKQAGTDNPVMLLDEIDKIGSIYKGDPSSALLEVLDPEQNFRFTDNFLEVPFDLSRVMFIATANTTSTIPGPLLDRMEIIHLPGYLAEEKIEIAKRHLLPKIFKEHGITAYDISISKPVLMNVIRNYTHEAGVRGLDRALSKIARKIAAGIAKNPEAERKKNVINSGKVKEYLGAPKLYTTRVPKQNAAGTSIGLAWTEAGGEVLLIESAVMEGTGNVTFTGNLGSIMQESLKNSMAYIRSNAKKFGLEKFEWQKTDVHVHVPENAVPKDGPSAGITLALSICSSLTGRKIDVSYAMTGEMTLHGEVLPIGGVREKILAAKRLGLKRLIVPADNKNDVAELKDWIKEGLEIHYVSNFDEVAALALKK
ncbi:MAG: endopeptidase La, partial [Synergistaceae bacterium]|nr:endopeptidase La [Synergistaceae bacterium]